MLRCAEKEDAEVVLSGFGV